MRMPTWMTLSALLNNLEICVFRSLLIGLFLFYLAIYNTKKISFWWTFFTLKSINFLVGSFLKSNQHEVNLNMDVNIC